MRDTGYWAKHFLDEVEAYKVEKGIALSSLGSPSFFYQSPQARIYIDPYLGPTPPEAETLFPGVYRTTAVPIYPPEIRQAFVGYGQVGRVIHRLPFRGVRQRVAV